MPPKKKPTDGEEAQAAEETANTVEQETSDTPEADASGSTDTESSTDSGSENEQTNGDGEQSTGENEQDDAGEADESRAEKKEIWVMAPKKAIRASKSKKLFEAGQPVSPDDFTTERQFEDFKTKGYFEKKLVDA